MATYFGQIDLNNDGLIDRCEDAKFLFAGAQNTADYSLNYGGYGTLSELQHYCLYIVPNAVDVVRWEKKADGGIVGFLSGIWPFSEIVQSLKEADAADDADDANN